MSQNTQTPPANLEVLPGMTDEDLKNLAMQMCPEDEKYLLRKIRSMENEIHDRRRRWGVSSSHPSAVGDSAETVVELLRKFDRLCTENEDLGNQIQRRLMSNW